MIERIGNRLVAITPRPVRKKLRRLKLLVMGRMSSASYWNLAATISPTAAIATDCVDEKEFYASGRLLRDLTRKAGLLDARFRVLNIGCGMGRYEAAIHSEVDSVVGVDVSGRMVELARQKVQAANARFEVVDGRSLNGIPSEQFDVCFSSYVFQHIPRPAVASYFREVSRVLKPGGHFLFQISVVGGPTHREAWEAGVRSEPPADHPFAVRCYPVEDVKMLLQQAGLVMLGRYNQAGDSGDASQDETGLGDYEYFLAKKAERARV